MEHPPPPSSRDAPREATDPPQNDLTAARLQVASAGEGEGSDFGYYATVVSLPGAVFTALLAVDTLLLTALSLAEQIVFLLASLALSGASIAGFRAWRSTRRFAVTMSCIALALVLLVWLPVSMSQGRAASGDPDRSPSPTASPPPATQAPPGGAR